MAVVWHQGGAEYLAAHMEYKHRRLVGKVSRLLSASSKGKQNYLGRKKTSRLFRKDYPHRMRSRPTAVPSPTTMVSWYIITN